MGACDIRYQLITPDGWTLDFAGPRFSWGTADSLMAHEGFGLPPVEHVTQEIYGMPGALIYDTIVKPRLVTIATTTHGLTRQSLHRARAKLNDAMRWNRGAKAQPSILRYTVNGVSRDLYVHYAGDVTRSVGRYGQVEVIGFRLVAYDPMFYDPATQEQVLDWQDSFTARNILARIDGLWDPMGPPAAVGGIGAPHDIVIDKSSGDIYVAGNFLDWANDLNADYLVRRRAATGNWEAVGDDGAGGPALNGIVRRMCLASDGWLYLAGDFTNAGGAAHPNADYIARVHIENDTYDDVGGGPGAGAVTSVYDVAIGHDGTIYIVGNFTDWAGLGSPAGDYIVQLPPGGAWATVGNGLSDIGFCCEVGPSGHLFIGGQFSFAGGVQVERITEWDGTVYRSLAGGANLPVDHLAFGPQGTLYAVGRFTIIGGVNSPYAAAWNGASWSAMGATINGQINSVAVADTGAVYVTGSFSLVDGHAADSIAKWNGSIWAPLDVDRPGAGPGTAAWGVTTWGADLYFGFQAAGTAIISGDNTIINAGNVLTYPTIEIKNAGLVQSMRNEPTGKEILMDMLTFDGEIVTIDLSPGVKTVTSNWRGNRLGDVLPNSDLAEFALESHPRAQYGGVEGGNLITVFITDAAPRETGDDNNQLSGWENVTGVSQHNTELGRLYVSIVFDGVDYHVELYMDSAKAGGDLVGHTADYAAPGAQAIIEDNDSGLGGTVTVDAVVGADSDIEVIYTIATIFWRNRWWDADSAVS